MDTLFDSLWLAIETILALILLALLAGFSPTLYLTQAGRAPTRSRRFDARALIIGVVAALALLILLFQFLHLDALVTLIGSTVSALVISRAVTILVGAACVYGGVRYLTQSPARTTISKTHASGSLMGFAFLKTFFSVSGMTATFIGTGIIANVSSSSLIHILLSVLFLTVSIAPFIGIMLLLERWPAMAQRFIDTAKRLIRTLPYRRIVGIGAISIGILIIAAQLMQLLMT